MATSVTLNGTTYQIPAEGDFNWGTELSNYFIAISTSVLQKTGGSFTLTSEVNFGATYGVKSAYLKSQAANPASAGIIRLGNTENISWRNQANNGDLALTVNASNQLAYNGTKVILSGAIINADVDAAAAIAYSKLNLSGSIVNADVSNSAAIAHSKMAALTASRAMVTDGSGFSSASSVTATELGYVSGVTSSIQTQLNTVTAGLFTTGDVKLTLKTVADSGWVLMNDTTIGSASSGATGRANADTESLFTLLWNNTSDTDCAVSGGRGASAAADFAANKTIALPKALGRALAVYGSGSGLTARALAAVVGTETHTLSESEMPSHTHVQNAHTHTQDSHNHNTLIRNATADVGLVSAASFANAVATSGSGYGHSGASNVTKSLNVATTATNQNTTATNQNTGGGGAHNNMQPTVFLNVMIKL